MTPIVAGRIHELAGVCSNRRVRGLALFGSAAGDCVNPSTSDLDLLVEFHPMSPVEHADAYFALQEDSIFQSKNEPEIRV